MGIALGVATLGGLAAVVYRGALALPAETPRPIAEAARQSLESAARTGDDAVLATARDAFTAGLATTAGVGALAFAVLAAVAVWALRSVPPIGTAEPAPAGDRPAGSERRAPSLA